MTLHSPDKFRASPPAGHDGLFDWDFLLGAFGARIAPMDLDCFVHRGNRFLVIETKRPGVPVPTGQRIALEALARLPQFTVVVAWGKSGREIQRFEVWHEVAGRPQRTEYRGDQLRAFCETWYARASW